MAPQHFLDLSEFKTETLTKILSHAHAMKAAGPDLNTYSLIASLEKVRNDSSSPLASPITFTDKHHVGNLSLHIMQVKNGAWEPLPWKSSRPSAILKRYE